MSDLFDEPDDATPLEPEERDGLLQTWITYRSELNEAEQSNIAAGTAWAYRQHRRDVLTDAFIKQLHAKLFSDVWAWAGDYRRSERNLGIDPVHIPVEIRMVLDDARYWVENKTYRPDEIAVRRATHHGQSRRRRSIDGSGFRTAYRSDRPGSMADRPGLGRLGQEQAFTWGRVGLTNVSETRTRHIAVLRAA